MKWVEGGGGGGMGHPFGILYLDSLITPKLVGVNRVRHV